MKYRLEKEAFCVSEINRVIQSLGDYPEAENKKIYEMLEKMKQDFEITLPEIYKKYQADIGFACDNGWNHTYEEMAGYEPDGVYQYSIFDNYFKELKTAIKENETRIEFVLDLISAKDRVESIRVIMLEAEANLKKYHINVE